MNYNNKQSDLTAYALGSGLGSPRYRSENAEAEGGRRIRIITYRHINNRSDAFFFSPHSNIFPHPHVLKSPSHRGPSSFAIPDSHSVVSRVSALPALREKSKQMRNSSRRGKNPPRQLLLHFAVSRLL